MPSFKQFESNYSKKEPSEGGCSLIIKFSHYLNFGYRKYMVLFFEFVPKMAVNAVCTEKKICEVNHGDIASPSVNNFRYSFSEELISF